MKNLMTAALAAMCLAGAVACSEKKEYVFVSPEISRTIELDRNLSHKGDTCWFTIGYGTALTKTNVSPVYGRIKYQIGIEGENPFAPVEIADEIQARNLSDGILTSNPEFMEWWKSRYIIAMPENIVFFAVPANMSESGRTVEVRACIPDKESLTENWNVVFSAIQDGKPASSIKKISIPLEFRNPVADLMVCDIDKGAEWQVDSDEDFSFEILDKYEDVHVPAPVSEYKDEFISASMEGKNRFRMTVLKQEKPYRTITKYVIFYDSQNEIIDRFSLFVDENISWMDF